MRREMYSIRVDRLQKEQWEQAARNLGVDTTQLVRATMNTISSWPAAKTAEVIDLESGRTGNRGTRA